MLALTSPVPVAGDPRAPAALRGSWGARADGAALPHRGLRGALHPGAAQEGHLTAGVSAPVRHQ